MAKEAINAARVANAESGGDPGGALDDLISLLESQAPTDADFDARFCQGLTGVFDAELASILDHIQPERQLRFRYSMDLDEQERLRIFIRLGEGVAGVVAYTGRTIRVENAMEASEPAARIARQTGRQVGALMAAPAIHHGHCVSVIEILNRRAGPFSEDHARTLRALAALYAARRAEALGAAKSKPRDAGLILPDEPAIIGSSPAVEAALRVAIKAAATDIPTLILGESGSGKELFARRIHDASPRAKGPFVAINCAALPENLLESELFGHARGAFTGADRARRGRLEEAEGGTVFLDEIGDMSPACQADLLRTLDRGEITPVGSNQTRRINVRFVSATHRPIDQMAREGTFRMDLFYRLCGVELRLPPLRERRGDIALLAEIFMRRAAAKAGRGAVSFDPAAVAALQNYPWPGNVRELQNIVERVVLMGEREVIAVEDLPESLRVRAAAPSPGPARGQSDDLPDRIMRALEETAYPGAGRWNLAATARRLGMPRKTLEYKIRKFFPAAFEKNKV